MSWNAEQYLRFGGHRLRPVIDLIAGIDHAGIDAPARVIDLGCGPGNATMLLAARWPSCELAGLDNDPAMLARARADHPDFRWIEGDIARWAADAPQAAFDVVFANAALHWIPDHRDLFPRLLRAVAPGGVFACQMPRNYAAPTHRLLRDTMKDPQWLPRLEAFADWEPVSPPDAYYEWLLAGCQRLDIWESEYLQVLEGENAVLEWIKGSALVPVRAALDAADYARFTRQYGAALREAYPRRSDGTTLLPFRRLFIVGKRPNASAV